jgi:hypothetical protein
MTTWSEYLKSSFGLQISIGVCLLLILNIMIGVMIEKARMRAGMNRNDRKIKSIVTMRKLWTGMLIGFVVTVAAGVAQFILRFGYFTLLQEIGVVFLGFIGAVIGALCSIFRWRRVSA